MENQNIEIPGSAVSIYNQGDAMDDFPVLKAFQQYIDAEHVKARKRLMTLGIFFGIFTGTIIAIFVVLLMNVSARNQALNDRLIDYAMKDRDRGQAAVVVQPPVQQDSSALIAVTAKLEELQRKLSEKDAREKAQAEAEAIREKEQEKSKGPTQAELEVVRLKALLSAEKEKFAEEMKRQKEKELEDYRRRHYPELYGIVPEEKEVEVEKKIVKRKSASAKKAEVDFDDDFAISYFDDDGDGERLEKKTTSPSRGHYSIPVEVRGSKSNWQIPND